MAVKSIKLEWADEGQPPASWGYGGPTSADVGVPPGSKTDRLETAIGLNQSFPPHAQCLLSDGEMRVFRPKVYCHDEERKKETDPMKWFVLLRANVEMANGRSYVTEPSAVMLTRPLRGGRSP